MSKIEATNDNVLILRAHHLLCTVLYTGHGYSKKFEDNMSQVVDRLLEGTLVKLKVSPDAICSECPNRMADGGCALDDEVAAKTNGCDARGSVGGDEGSPQKNIKSLDERVLEFFQLSADIIYDSRAVFKNIEVDITKRFFDSCCGECRWAKQGLCSFEGYKNNLHKFT